MKNKEVVNVVMYGGKDIFGGRETKRVAVVGRCEFAGVCKALKQGRCAAYNPRMYNCQYLETSSHEGYTSRAKKFHEFIDKWKSHEKYNVIEDGLKRFDYVGDGMIRIELPHIDIHKALEGKNGHDAFRAKNVGYIKESEFTLESLINLMNSYSYPLMGGGKLKATDKKQEILIAIKELNKELYNLYEKETDTTIDYKGKLAYLKTIKKNTQLPDGWYWDGVKLSKADTDRVHVSRESGIKGFLEGSEISFVPEDEAVIEIKNNDWVTNETKFK